MGKKFEGVLFCTDLDGTLIDDNKGISEENIAAIRYFMDNGGYFTFITGRVPRACSKIYDAVSPNAPIGAVNGAGVWDFERSKYLFTIDLDRSALNILDFVLSKMPDISFVVHTHKNAYFFNDGPELIRYRKITGLPYSTCDLNDLNEPMCKIVFDDFNHDNIAALMSLIASHPDSEKFDLIRSAPDLYEILPKNAKKSLSLGKISEILGIDIKNTIAIGDFNNDISMVKMAGIGVAVENACDDLKNAADFVTVSNNESAIAKVIYALDSGEIKL